MAGNSIILKIQRNYYFCCKVIVFVSVMLINKVFGRFTQLFLKYNEKNIPQCDVNFY